MKVANDKNFADVISTDKLVLIDFYATWCMPCSMQKEVLDKLENSRVCDIDIIKVNVDEAPNISNDFEISSIPTLILMKDKNILKRKVGFTSEQELIELLEEVKEK